MIHPRARRLSLVATCILVPLDLWLTFGFTFTSPQNISFWHWAFVWFTFLLNIPAVLISWMLPRVSAYWLLANTAVSLAIASGFLWHSYLEGRASGDGFFTALGVVAMRAALMAVLLWGPQLFFACAFLFYLRRNTNIVA